MTKCTCLSGGDIIKTFLHIEKRNKQDVCRCTHTYAHKNTHMYHNSKLSCVKDYLTLLHAGVPIAIKESGAVRNLDIPTER